MNNFLGSHDGLFLKGGGYNKLVDPLDKDSYSPDRVNKFYDEAVPYAGGLVIWWLTDPPSIKGIHVFEEARYAFMTTLPNPTYFTNLVIHKIDDALPSSNSMYSMIAIAGVGVVALLVLKDVAEKKLEQ
jgi:hypothetical protein